MRRAGNVRGSDRDPVCALERPAVGRRGREPPASVARPRPRRRSAPGPATSRLPPGRTAPSDSAIEPARHRAPGEGLGPDVDEDDFARRHRARAMRDLQRRVARLRAGLSASPTPRPPAARSAMAAARETILTIISSAVLPHCSFRSRYSFKLIGASVAFAELVSFSLLVAPRDFRRRLTRRRSARSRGSPQEDRMAKKGKKSRRAKLHRTCGAMAAHMMLLERFPSYRANQMRLEAATTRRRDQRIDLQEGQDRHHQDRRQRRLQDGRAERVDRRRSTARSRRSTRTSAPPTPTRARRRRPGPGW